MIYIDVVLALGIFDVKKFDEADGCGVDAPTSAKVHEARRESGKGMRAGRLPLTFNFVPSSATSSPFLFRHDLDFENDSTFVSRAGTDAGICLRMFVATRLALTGGVDPRLVGVAVPAAFRFFGFVATEVAPGAGSLAMVWLFALEWAPLVVTD